ncbi:pyridine nucleotide-disulfide oxidoreductase-domain-containing protein [Powellomyces hirtus]|nr:pyridine nucleotide-disulfide oxidoreductase-domain-containing protein [Powellomyces hirtus]
MRNSKTASSTHITAPMHHAHIVVGAGPGGIQTAYFLSRASADVLVLDQAQSVGSSFKLYPRHRQLISINKTRSPHSDREAKLRTDWNSLLLDDAEEEFSFGAFSKDYFPQADRLVDYLQEFADRFKIPVSYQSSVRSVHRLPDSKFLLQVVRSNAGAERESQWYTCDKLIWAAGVPTAYIPPEFTQWKDCFVTYADMTLDLDHFDDKRVLIVGKGNSAFETADHLVPVTRHITVCSPSPIKLAYNTHYVGNVRALNHGFLDTYQLKSDNTIFDATIKRIEKRSDGSLDVLFAFSHAGGQEFSILYDEIILSTGWASDRGPWEQPELPEMAQALGATACCPKMTPCGKLFAMNGDWQSANVKNLYFAGGLTQALDYKKTHSNVIHGFRYNARTLARILLSSFSDPSGEVRPLHRHSFASGDLPSIVNHMLKRFSHTSSMTNQPGFLCDVIAVARDSVKIYEDLTVPYTRDVKLMKKSVLHPDAALTGASIYLVCSMEYGNWNPNTVLSHERNPNDASHDVYLHPVIRTYCAGKQTLLDQVVLPENVFNVFNSEPYSYASELLVPKYAAIIECALRKAMDDKPTPIAA